MKDCSRLTRAELIDLARAMEQTMADQQTEQARHVAALRDSEARLRAILETAVEGIITIDERGVIESFNPAAERIFGYRAVEVIGQNIKVLMPEPYRHEHDGHLHRYQQTGQAHIIGVGREVAGRRKDGTVFPLDLSVSAVQLAGRRLFAGFVRDITERKTAEKGLLHYAALVESSDDAIVGKTLEGYITSWNKGAEVLFGFHSDEAIGRHISLIIPPDRADEEAAILARVKRGESVEHYETIRRRRDGSPVAISVTVSPIREPGGRIIGASKMARNITDRRRLENEILQISEREQRRIGNDLHDGLCQELAGIELMCQVLGQRLEARARITAGQMEEIAAHIREATQHARKLARGLSPVELEVNGFMSALHELAAHAQTLFRIKCRLECPVPVLIRNHTAATHLYRIVQEAVNNAVKHGRPRNIVIALQPAAEHITLTIMDDGAGFTGATQPGGGMGLQIMRYRAAVIDAVLKVEPNAEARGVTVTCIFRKDL